MGVASKFIRQSRRKFLKPILDPVKSDPVNLAEVHDSEITEIDFVPYRLNPRNYVSTLHGALTRECYHNLFNPSNRTLDFDTISDVTRATLKAIQDHRVFSVLGYFPKVSRELKERGWVEKRDPHRPPVDYSLYLKSAPNAVNWIESPPLVPPPTTGAGEDAVWERLKNEHSWTILNNRPSDLIFVTRKRLVNWSNLNEMTSVSQMANHVFCSKNGLAQCLEPYKNRVSNLMFPRCHYIRNEADYDAFVEDYITTALVGTLKIIVQAIGKNKTMFTENGTIPYAMIDFAKQCVFKFLSSKRANLKERDMWKYHGQKDMWDEFLNYHTKLVIDDSATFCQEYTYELEQDVYATCKHLLKQVKDYRPQHYIDGNTNMWIIKPTSNCSGHGIILSRDLNKIKKINTVAEGSRNKYILQKYIESPLLVYTCKVDLRQWFLVTNMNPVVVWMYKEGYVRFCANNFTMKNMHESVHLSNVRLQMKYRKMRNSNVPEESMWDYKELQNHLATIGQGYVWDELIFPGMSESIYAVLEATVDTSYYRDKTFQLFGADFVITDNYVPYLIEINSMPGLNPSTSVIANLVPMLLADIVKVVVDYQGDPNADTGLFVKVVPEGPRMAALAEGTAETTKIAATDVADGSGSKPGDHNTAAYRQRMERVNQKLEAIRSRMAARGPQSDRTTSVPDRDHDKPQSTTGMTSEVTAAASAGETALDDELSSPQERIARLRAEYGLKTYRYSERGGRSLPRRPEDDQKRR